MPTGDKPSPPSRADGLADIVLPDHECHDVRLGDLWSDRPVALVWLRHYGWLYCRAHAMQLHRARAKFEEAGGRVVLIGQRTPRDAATFRRRQGIQLPILADEKLVSYKAAGAKVGGLRDLLSPMVVAKGVLTSLREKTIQGRTQGDAAQLGGALVIRPDGEVVWSHMSTDAGDDASPEQIVAALRKAAA